MVHLFFKGFKENSNSISITKKPNNADIIEIIQDKSKGILISCEAGKPEVKVESILTTKPSEHNLFDSIEAETTNKANDLDILGTKFNEAIPIICEEFVVKNEMENLNQSDLDKNKNESKGKVSIDMIVPTKILNMLKNFQNNIYIEMENKYGVSITKRVEVKINLLTREIFQLFIFYGTQIY